MDSRPNVSDTIRFDAIRVSSAPEALAEQIVARIRAGNLAPGTCLPSQRELARGFRVGLGSVREAVKILNVMGYLDVVPGRGTYISENARRRTPGPSPFDRAMEAVSLAELMKAREVVETGATRMAARRADAESIRRLNIAVSRLDPGGEDPEVYYRNDFAFHLAVAEAADNPALYEIVKLLVDKSHHHTGFMNTALGISLPACAERCVTTAARVARFIQQGNEPEAERAMREHLNVVNYELDRQFPGPKPRRGGSDRSDRSPAGGAARRRTS